jgi:hypothetical protein
MMHVTAGLRRRQGYGVEYPWLHRNLRAADDPVTGRMVLIEGSRTQIEVGHPVSAFDLYDARPVRDLRDRLGGTPAWRRQVRLLSVRYGLVYADQLITPYRWPLPLERAYHLREPLAGEIHTDWLFDGVPAEVLVVASPLWMVALGGLLRLPERPRVHWYTPGDADRPEVTAVLDRWGWR